MTAIRSVLAAEGKFVQIANAATQDRRLSYTARGILAYVLSLPPDRRLTAEWLESQSPDSRRAVRAALRELETLGYYRKTKRSGGRGVWIWDQVMSDAPLTATSAGESGVVAFPQVTSSDHHTQDVNTPDVTRPDKELKTDNPNTQKMVHGRASRRARASGASAIRTVDQVVRDIRAAVAEVHGQQEADGLDDQDALGLYFTYVGNRGPKVRDLIAYAAGIFKDAPYIDTFLANSAPACTRCQHWEDDCACPAAA